MTKYIIVLTSIFLVSFYLGAISKSNIPINSQEIQQSVYISPTPTLRELSLTPTKNPTVRLTVKPTNNPTTSQVKGESTIFNLVQEYRFKQGLPTMTIDPLLCKYASIRAEEIKTDWSHNGFLNKVSPQIYRESKYRKLGENLAKDFNSDRDMFQGWLNSPLHRENIDYPYTKTCLVCSSHYCAQLFGL